MATRRGTPEDVAQAIGRIVRALADGRQVADAFGAELAREIRADGASTGVPRQAHLVARSIFYANEKLQASMAAPAGRGTVGELIFGAELGSSVYTQFGPRRSRGTWLFPAIRDPSPEVLAAGERGLDDLIADAI